MTARIGFLIVIALGCTEARTQEFALRAKPAATTVEFGEGFDLTVERVWPSGFEPEPWSDDALAPLLLEGLDVSRDEEPGRSVETRTFRARSFVLGEITVPAPSFRARPADGGPARTVTADALRFTVTSALGSGEPGPVELPREPFPAPFPWRSRALTGLAALSVLGLAVWMFARRHSTAVSTPGATPAARALARLADLRTRDPRGAEETRAFHVDAAWTLRDFVAARFDVPTREFTTDEWLTAARAVMSAPQREGLATLLAPCDLAKFARSTPTSEQRAAWLNAAEGFVRGVGER